MIKRDKNKFVVGSTESGGGSPQSGCLSQLQKRNVAPENMQKASLLGRLALHFQAMGFTLNLKPFAFYLIAIFGLLALGLNGQAQIYPVQVTPVLVPPYSLNTSDYYNSTTERLAIVLTNTDLQKPVLSVRLRMYIEGQNAKLQSKDGVYYPTITLDAGIPQRISLGDLAPYFNVDNLNFSGITRSMYAQNSKLPEGFYSFCFEAIEVYTGQVLSRKSCSMAYITLSDPPLLNIPVKGESIANREVQNIIFQWTPRNLGSPNGAFNTEYEFTLKELWDTGIPPEAAFQSTQPLYQVTVRPTTLLMGPAEPQLIPGKRYAWRVRAVSTSPTGEQLDSYRNNGFSEIYWFTYQSDCRPPLAINSSVTGGRATISWTPDPANNGTPAGGYTLQYRERSLSGSKWYSVNTLENRAVLYDLKPGTSYEYRVGSSCVAGNIGIGTDQTTYSDILTLEISGNPNDTRTVNCGMISPEIAIANRTPIQALNQGDLIMAGSFPVKLTKVSGNGSFSGEGYVTIPMLGQANVKVRFSGIQVNSERQLFAGVIETTYDPNEKQVTNLDKVIEGGDGAGIVVTGTVAAEHEVDFPIKGVDNIKPVLKDKDGNVIPEGSTTPAASATITVDNGSGKTTTIEADKIPTTIKDSEGTVYKVEQGADGKPKVTKVSENVPLKISPAELNTLAANKGVVTFQPHPKQLFAFDEYQSVYAKSKVFSDVYQKLGDNYFVSAKAILPGKTDLVKATVKLNDDKLKADSVQFITGKGSKVQATKLQDGSYEITIVGGPADDAQELYAVYPLAGGKYLTLGKLFIASYQPKTVRVALVPVNGTTLNKNEITEQLNNAYNPIGVSFTVREANNFVNTDWDLNKDNKLAVSGSGFLATQTAEMKALINVYKSANPSLAKDEAVLFMLNSSDSTANLAGDMPRGKQFGYLFSGADGTTAAHEIGHGVFKLEHTFKKYGFSASDLAGNMMNYPPGAGLTKFQWDAIHAPGIVIGVFEGDEDAMLAGGFGLSPDFKLISTNTNKILADATPTADPFVGGFVSINKDNTEEYYYWREKDKPYQTNQGKDYVAPKVAATDESVIWLLVNNSKDCKDRRYIRTLYKEVKTLIGNEDLAGLQKYVDRYLNQTDRSKPVYAGVLGCGKTGDGQGAGSNVLFVDYSTGKDGKSPFTAGQKNSLDKTITGIDNGLETALKVYLLNTGNPNYATQKAEAENDKAANKFIVTYNEQNQKLNLQHKLSIPKWLSDALPEATTDACVDKYVNDGLDELHNDPLYKVAPSFDQALQEINVVAYRGMFGILYCATNEESVQNASATAKFVAGGLHEIIATVDVKELVKGLAKMGAEATTATVKSYQEFYQDTKQTFQDVRTGKTIDNAVLIQRLLPPGLRTKVKLANTIVKVAKQFSSFYFTDCDTYKFTNGQTGDICAYRYGQITVMVVPIVFTAGEYAIAKGSALVARLKTISTLGRTEEVVNLLSKADDVGTVISEAEKIIIKSGDEVRTVVKEPGKAVIIDGVESIDDAIKVLEREIADPDLLKTAKEKAIAEAAEDASVLKDKTWLENIIKGNKFERDIFAEYAKEGKLLRDLEKEMGLAEGYLSKQNGFDHLKQVQIKVGDSYFIADDVWVKRLPNNKFECYVSESKLNKGTNLSKYQNQFSNALKTTKDFEIRSVNNINPMKKGSLIEVRGAKRINGPDVNNPTFTEF